MGGAVIYRDCV